MLLAQKIKMLVILNHLNQVLFLRKIKHRIKKIHLTLLPQLD